MSFQLIPARIEDAAVIEPNICDIDRTELWSICQPGDEIEILQLAIYGAVEAYTLWDGEKPVVILGYYVDSLVDSEAHPWVVWSDYPIDIKDFMQIMKGFDSYLFDRYNRVSNYSRADNPKVQKLWRILGGTVSRDTVFITDQEIPILMCWKDK